jgi:hypothetical protein
MTTSNPKEFIEECQTRAAKAGYKLKIWMKPKLAFQWSTAAGAYPKQYVPKQKTNAEATAACMILASAWINQELNLGIELTMASAPTEPSEPEDNVVPFNPQPQLEDKNHE